MYSNKIINFNERWNIGKEKKDYIHKIQEFMKRTTNSVLIVLEYTILHGKFNNTFLEIIGEQIDLWYNNRNYSYHWETPIYKKLTSESNSKKYILYLETFFWLNSLSESVKQKLYERFCEDINATGIDIKLFKQENDYFFYPSGAKLLDKNLVEDVLYWVKDYKDVYNNFKSALEKYQNRKFNRNIIDDMRLALELLLKKILCNEKSLENQKSDLAAFFDKHNIKNESKKLCTNILANYTDYHNNFVKHIKKDNEISEYEVEFMIYLTGTFIRHIINIDKS